MIRDGNLMYINDPVFGTKMVMGEQLAFEVEQEYPDQKDFDYIICDEYLYGGNVIKRVSTFKEVVEFIVNDFTSPDNGAFRTEYTVWAKLSNPNNSTNDVKICTVSFNDKALLTPLAGPNLCAYWNLCFEELFK